MRQATYAPRPQETLRVFYRAGPFLMMLAAVALLLLCAREGLRIPELADDFVSPRVVASAFLAFAVLISIGLAFLVPYFSPLGRRPAAVLAADRLELAGDVITEWQDLASASIFTDRRRTYLTLRHRHGGSRVIPVGPLAIEPWQLELEVLARIKANDIYAPRS